MKTLKLYVHSFIDVITNSSTEMFVDQSKCLEPCRQMINEMLAAFDIDKSCEEIFRLVHGAKLSEHCSQSGVEE